MKPYLLFIIVTLGPTHSQLIGRRGVFTLRDGKSYRDEETLNSSYKAANLAKEYQKIQSLTAQQNRIQSIGVEDKPVRFSTKFTGVPIGSPRSSSEIFGYSDSLRIDPADDQKKNKPNEEVDEKRDKETSPPLTPSNSSGSRLLFPTTQIQFPVPSSSRSSPSLPVPSRPSSPLPSTSVINSPRLSSSQILLTSLQSSPSLISSSRGVSRTVSAIPGSQSTPPTTGSTLLSAPPTFVPLNPPFFPASTSNTIIF